MSDGTPTLEVGFAIDIANSFVELARLDGVIDEVTANALSEFNKVERLAKGFLNLGNATASVKTFGAAATRELETARQAANKLEKQSDGLIRSLERQGAAFGKPREELRAMKVETMALALEQAGLTDQAARLRAAEQALYDQEFAAMRRAQAEAAALAEAKAQAALVAQQEAEAVRAAAQAHAIFEAKVRQGVAAMKEKEAAAAADAVALARLREMLDPAAAAQDRLNHEMAEASRVMIAAGHSHEEVARAQALLAQRATGVTRSTGQLKAGMQQLSYNLNDMATMWAMNASATQIFASQAGQTIQAIQLMSSESKGLLGILGGPWGLVITSALVVLTPFVAKLFEAGEAAEKSAKQMKSFATAANLAAVSDGIKRQQEELGKLQAQYDRAAGPSSQSKAFFAQTELGKKLALQISQTSAGIASDQMLLTRHAKVLDDAAASSGKSASQLVELQADLTAATTPLEKAQAQLALVKARSTAADKLGGEALKAYERDYLAAAKAVKAAEAAQKSATKATQEGSKAANEAAKRARDAAAVEAQIKNLYALAGAYGVSGAAALVAEARVKAESQAIKQRADVDAAVDRQIRLAVAQRVADADKATAAMVDQAKAQEQVNAMVATGLVPAERAADLVRDRIADLPLLAAIEAAQQQKLADEVVKTTKALEDQRAARDRATDAARTAQYLAAQAGAADEIERLQLEQRMIDATTEARVRALATLKAWQEAQRAGWNVDEALAYVAAQVNIADQQQKVNAETAQYNEQLRLAADLADSLGDSLSKAFGRGGAALGDMVKILGTYGARQDEIDKQVKSQQISQAAGAKLTADLQMSSLIGLTDAAKGFFGENSKGYRAMMVAERALTIVQVARTAVDVAGGAARMFATLGPLAFPAVAAMLGVMASLGFSGGGSAGAAPQTNGGTGTVFGDPSAKSDSVKRSLDLLGDLDSETLVFTRQMAASLKSIETNIGGLTNLVIRLGGTDGIGANAASGVNTGYNPLIGKTLSNLVLGGLPGLIVGPLLAKIPVIGDILGFAQKLLGGLFGTKTSIVGSGIYAGSQTFGDIASLGFDAQAYADIKKTKKVLGVSTGSKYSTKYGDLDDALQQQFGLLLTSFGDAIKMAAGPLGIDLDTITARLNGFVVSIGKIDLKGLSGDEIREKLESVFGAEADKMAQFAIAGLEKFQQVGEGYFETLVRVASTVDVVTTSLEQLGLSATSLGIDASMAIAGYFDSASAYQDAAGAYFSTYYSEAEQAAARTAQLGKVFSSLGITMPDSIASFRALVEAQDLTTAAGQQMYATLLEIAPAFAEIVSAGQSAASAAAILRETNDLQKQLYEAEGNTAALRQMERDALDPSNRALYDRIQALRDEAAISQQRDQLERQLLQLDGNTAELRARDLALVPDELKALQRQVWAKQDEIAAAQEAAQKAKELADAWGNVGDSILDEINRIRGIPAGATGASFVSLQGSFNAALAAARLGDIDAAKNLPGLSKSLLEAAAAEATSSQELVRIQALTANSLQSVYDMINGGVSSSAATNDNSAAAADWMAQASAAAAVASTSSTSELGEQIVQLRQEMAEDRKAMRAQLAAIAGSAGRIDATLQRASEEGEGTLAVTVVEAA